MGGPGLEDVRRGRATIPAVVTPVPYTAISLYSGAGGLDLGFARAGFDVQWAIDHDRFAVETYNAQPGAARGPWRCAGDRSARWTSSRTS